MDKYKAELERRRERGRLAQSAFRRRQVLAKQEIQKENIALKQVLRAIANEVRPDDRLELRRKIQEATSVVKLHTDSQGDNISSEESIRTDSIFSPLKQQNHLAARLNSQPLPAARVKQIASGQVVGSSGYVNPDMYSDLSIARDPFQRHRCNDGVAAVLPFLGDGAFTVAGRIFWHLVKKFEDTKHVSPQLPQVPVAATTTSLQFIDLLDQSKLFRHIEPAHWLAMIEARLAIREPQHTAGQMKNDQLGQEHEASASRSRWLSPISAEARIRTIVGDDVFAILATPALGRREKNEKIFAGQSSTAVIDDFFDRLSESFVCFGDGPRWAIEKFDKTLTEWCHSIITPHLVLETS